jgi:hypothetical protein
MPLIPESVACKLTALLTRASALFTVIFAHNSPHLNDTHRVPVPSRYLPWISHPPLDPSRGAGGIAIGLPPR